MRLHCFFRKHCPNVYDTLISLAQLMAEGSPSHTGWLTGAIELYVVECSEFISVLHFTVGVAILYNKQKYVGSWWRQNETIQTADI